MTNVIETNILLYDDGTLADHQSRIIEVESWDSYVDEFINNKTVHHRSPSGMHGISIPRNCIISNIKHDSFHISCEIIKGDYKMLKLGYRIWNVVPKELLNFGEK